MITITRGITNQIILTLTERVTISNPVFLFEFICDETRQAYCFIAADTSTYTYRYNEFQITETDTPNLLASQVSLPSPGDYHYAVYQQSSASNLDTALAQGVLECGKMRVIDAAFNPSNIVYNSEDETNVVYRNEQ